MTPQFYTFFENIKTKENRYQSLLLIISTFALKTLLHIWIAKELLPKSLITESEHFCCGNETTHKMVIYMFIQRWNFKQTINFDRLKWLNVNRDSVERKILPWSIKFKAMIQLNKIWKYKANCRIICCFWIVDWKSDTVNNFQRRQHVKKTGCKKENFFPVSSIQSFE